ncbi:MAG TPA: response regulator [Chloroflexota bacterium]|nr:response regulator [Chloroflexota bacterium]
MVTVAVVNDDPAFLDLMNELLEMEGYGSLVVREAPGAYDRLKAEHPDLVVLDIRMGGDNEGWQIAECLTLDPETKHIPIILCSAAVDELRQKMTWLQEHGVGALTKPFDLDDLLRAVQDSLTGRPPVIGLGPAAAN